MSILLSINPSHGGVRVPSDVVFTVKNCTMNGTYRHGTFINGKRQISGWASRFITRVKYGADL